MPTLFQSAGTIKQAYSVMRDPQDITDTPGATPLTISTGEIIFDNVTFHYGERKLFQNKNAHIRGGERVGLVGYTGAGKSTFISLILRFFRHGSNEGNTFEWPRSPELRGFSVKEIK